MPISSSALTLAIGKGVTAVTKRQLARLTRGAINWASRKRATHYIESFLWEFQRASEGLSTNMSIDDGINYILADEQRSEMFFECYRRVVLSASKDLGPRLTGRLAARIIVENREPTRAEEQIFLAAEQLNDGELRSFANFAFVKAVPKGSSSERRSRLRSLQGRKPLRVKLKAFNEDDRSADQELSESLALAVGIWAQKLLNIGIIAKEISKKTRTTGHSIQIRQGKANSEPSLSTTITVWLVIDAGCLELAELIERAEEILHASQDSR